MARNQTQFVETPGTQASASDDFDAEAQARLEELLKQAKVSVENKAKRDFQKLKTDIEKSMKELVRKRIHMARTHQEEFDQLANAIAHETAELAEEEDAIVATFAGLSDEGEGEHQYKPLTEAHRTILNDMTEVNAGCLDVLGSYSTKERAVPSRLFEGRINLNQLDSARQKGGSMEVEEEMYEMDAEAVDDGGDDDAEIADVEMQLGSKNTGGNRR